MSESVGVVYDAGVEGRGSVWCNIEQKYIPQINETADYGTLDEMLQLIYTTRSAIDAVYETCDYAVLRGNDVIVELGFFIWPYDMNLDYQVKSTIGEISVAQTINKDRSFDVKFDGTDVAYLPFIFEGEFTSSMPVYKTDGSLSHTEFEEEGDSKLVAEERVHTVFRADGKVRGYSHTVTMVFNKGDANEGNKITNVNLEILLTYKDETGEVVSTVLPMDIPACVLGLLEFCENDKPYGSNVCIDNDCDGTSVFNVYYSTCEEDTVLAIQEDRND